MVDIKWGFRQLRKRPAFYAGSILTIAFAIGVSLTVFCAFRAVFLQPPPYSNPEGLVSIEKFDANRRPLPLRRNDFNLVREHSHSFLGLALLFGYPEMQTLSESRKGSVRIQRVSANLFSVIGVKPLLGRVVPSPDTSGAALLSSRAWQRLFLGGPVIGRKIFLHRQSYEIIGVLPQGFDVPNAAVDVWIANHVSSLDPFPPITGLIGRLKPGVTTEGATGDVRRLTPPFEIRPLAWRDRRFYISLFVLLVLGAVGILVLALLNVASSLMGRANARQFEFAVRNAFGAVRSRLFAQVMIESLVLSSSGGLLGVIFGYAGVRAIRQLIPESAGLTRLQMTHLDAAGWCFALGASIIMGLFLGVTPAMFLSKISSAKMGQSFVPRQPIVGIVLLFLLGGFQVGGLIDPKAASCNLLDQRTSYGNLRPTTTVGSEHVETVDAFNCVLLTEYEWGRAAPLLTN
ncbi:MAG TPA: ABC transporter permease [Bryobacteraceae bacterium]